MADDLEALLRATREVLDAPKRRIDPDLRNLLKQLLPKVEDRLRYSRPAGGEADPGAALELKLLLEVAQRVREMRESGVPLSSDVVDQLTALRGGR